MSDFTPGQRGELGPPDRLQWPDTFPMRGRQYTCGYCGSAVTGNRGFPSEHPAHAVYLCAVCDKPTFFLGADQVPSPRYGNMVPNLPPALEALYIEACHCMSIEAYTSSVLLCRRILMHIAVAQGAAENQPFDVCLEFLIQRNIVPPRGMGWVETIRRRGDIATHEIPQLARSDADQFMTYIELLLRFTYAADRQP